MSGGFVRVGIPESFDEGGSTLYLFKKHGFTTDAVVAAFRRVQRTTGR